MERLDKYLSSRGAGSRKEVQGLIKSGAVTVDGAVCKQTDLKIDPDSADVTVNGQAVGEKFVYIMMNKPAGVVSATEDSRDKTVIDILPSDLKRRGLFPAGRLDKDTEGLLIITNDGDFAHRMLSPKKHVYKLYSVECDKLLSEDDVTRFAQGISSGEDTILPAAMKITGDNSALVEICEGKFHQIKRMFHAVGAEVTALKRLRIGGVYLDDSLSEGQWRELTDEEIRLITDNSIKELS